MDTTMMGPLTVSRLGLGAMLMGGRTPPDEAERILDRYLVAGGNFIDTADVYENGGSEPALAPWLARHRDEVVVSTKVGFEVSDPGGAGLDPDRIRAACDAAPPPPIYPQRMLREQVGIEAMPPLRRR
jgi:aryl-alcohol dehydrogenase-like predicted oxidoreductase